MKRDYSTFVLLPQKTSLYIDSQVNNLKRITRLKNVLKLASMQVLLPFNLIGENLYMSIVKLINRKLYSHHSIFKHSNQ